MTLEQKHFGHCAMCMHIVYVAKSLSQSWSSKDWVNTQFKDWVNSQSWSHSWGWPVGQGSLHWNIIARMMIINININININNNINIELPRFETSLLNLSILFPPAVYWDLATRPFTWNTIRCRLVYIAIAPRRSWLHPLKVPKIAPTEQ